MRLVLALALTSLSVLTACWKSQDIPTAAQSSLSEAQAKKTLQACISEYQFTSVGPIFKKSPTEFEVNVTVSGIDGLGHKFSEKEIAKFTIDQSGTIYLKEFSVFGTVNCNEKLPLKVN